MSGWQYAAQNTSLAIYWVQRGVLVMFGETFNLLKTPFVYRDQNFFDVTFRSTIYRTQANLERVQTEKGTANRNDRYEVFCKQFPSPVEKTAVTNIPTIPSVLPIERTNHIDLHVCTNINQSEPEGQILTLASG